MLSSTDRPAATPEAVAERLDELSRRLFPGATGAAKVRRLSGGSSQETWAFETAGAARNELVLRRGPGGIERPRVIAAGLATEARLIELAGAHGVPVPKLRHVLSPEDGLGNGFVMDSLPGETIARKVLRDPEFAPALPLLARQCGEALARLHALPVADLGLRVSDAAGEVEEYYRRYLDQEDPHPVFELAFRWLRDNLPAPVPPTLVHSDYRLGNLMIGPEGLRGVLDWEIAHLGDPMEDLAFMCVPSWRFGNLDKPVGGFGEIADFHAGYRAAGGTIDEPRIRWWLIYGTLKWGVICGGMALSFRNGVDPSAERGVIGRRASETEIDLLDMLTGGR